MYLRSLQFKLSYDHQSVIQKKKSWERRHWRLKLGSYQNLGYEPYIACDWRISRWYATNSFYAISFRRKLRVHHNYQRRCFIIWHATDLIGMCWKCWWWIDNVLVESRLWVIGTCDRYQLQLRFFQSTKLVPTLYNETVVTIVNKYLFIVLTTLLLTSNRYLSIKMSLRFLLSNKIMFKVSESCKSKEYRLHLRGTDFLFANGEQVFSVLTSLLTLLYFENVFVA